MECFRIACVLNNMTQAPIYETITAAVCTAIEQGGNAPWTRPWVGGAEAGIPHNAKSGKAYRGINVLVLMCQAWSRGYSSGVWLTYRQAKELGGNVEKGQKGTKIVFWKLLDDRRNPGEKIPMARPYTVFNVAQCEGLPEKFSVRPEPLPNAPGSVNQAAEMLIGSSAAPIVDGPTAAYSPRADEIIMPARERFHSLPDYYATAFHEIGHSTGHKDRLGRDLSVTFGNHAYSKEELVAEFTSCFLCAHCGFSRDTFENSVSYLRIWVSKLREQPKMLMQAAQQAQKAADLILAGVEQDQAAA